MRTSQLALVEPWEVDENGFFLPYSGTLEAEHPTRQKCNDLLHQCRRSLREKVLTLFVRGSSILESPRFPPKDLDCVLVVENLHPTKASEFQNIARQCSVENRIDLAVLDAPQFRRSYFLQLIHAVRSASVFRDESISVPAGGFRCDEQFARAVLRSSLLRIRRHTRCLRDCEVPFGLMKDAVRLLSAEGALVSRMYSRDLYDNGIIAASYDELLGQDVIACLDQFDTDGTINGDLVVDIIKRVMKRGSVRKLLEDL